MAQMTKSERIARDKLLSYMQWDQRDGLLDEWLRETVPDAWHTLEHDLDVTEAKEKVTLYLDRSVARFYRGMGKGYQARINRILGTWAQMKIAGFVRLDGRMRDAAKPPK